ncbi:MAG: protein sspF [Paenibacillaceae bacterium ZCTH02-B3]|jgi:small acid-soluble spore protein F (minor alpha/beta-type SASP)|nr:MAG: protein sspF [Paenibacillaceae bacterium ZCTH02-B3]
MGRRRGVMSDRFKEELARELGFYDTVRREGWGAIRARDAGNMVKRAIELAEKQIASGTKQF